ncbi:MAG: hypothetical protein ABI169_09310 [Chitinophagaceae bacterium]
MRNKLLFTILVLGASTVLFSCKKSGDDCKEKPVTKENIQGRWYHDYPTKMAPDFTHPDQYNHIRYVDDSFFLEVTHRGDSFDTAGCNKIYWKEFAKGVYNISDNKLYYSGIYTEADFTVKTDGCYHIGSYADSVKISYCSNYLVLYSLRLSMGYPDSYRTANMLKE